MTHSVVRSRAAIEAAFCRAVRVTFLGSTTPASIFVIARGDVVASLPLFADSMRELSTPALPVRGGVLRQRVYDFDNLLIAFELEGIESGQAAQESDTTTRDDAFFDGSAGCVESVFDACFLLLHFAFSGGTDIDDGHTAGELGQAFLELLAVVIGGRFLDLAADLVHAALDISSLAVTFDDSGIILIDDDGLCAAEIRELDVSSLRPRSVMHLPPVRMAISRDRFAAHQSQPDGAGTDAAELADDEGSEGFSRPFEIMKAY